MLATARSAALSSALAACQAYAPPPAPAEVQAPCPTASVSTGAAPAAALPAPPTTPGIAEPPAPEPSPPPPIVLSVGSAGATRSLELSYRRAGPKGPWVIGAITLDGEPLLLEDCGKRKSGLCSPDHQSLRGLGPWPSRWPDDQGKGVHLRVLALESLEDRAFALFSSGFWGSPECGTYALWVLRLDAKGARVTEPVHGCFLTPVSEQERGGPVPALSFSDPPTFWFESPPLTDPKVAVYTLDEATMTLQRRVTSKTRR